MAIRSIDLFITGNHYRDLGNNSSLQFYYLFSNIQNNFHFQLIFNKCNQNDKKNKVNPYLNELLTSNPYCSVFPNGLTLDISPEFNSFKI
jgi:hypothetical protein